MPYGLLLKSLVRSYHRISLLVRQVLPYRRNSLVQPCFQSLAAFKVHWISKRLITSIKYLQCVSLYNYIIRTYHCITREQFIAQNVITLQHSTKCTKVQLYMNIIKLCLQFLFGNLTTTTTTKKHYYETALTISMILNHLSCFEFLKQPRISRKLIQLFSAHLLFIKCIHIGSITI